jgi:DNA-binding NarL/FixJ family response regulator
MPSPRQSEKSPHVNPQSQFASAASQGIDPPQAPTTAGTAKVRSPGRPPLHAPVVTPEILMHIGELFLMGKSLREIGRQLKLDHKTVKLHLEDTVNVF